SVARGIECRMFDDRGNRNGLLFSSQRRCGGTEQDGERGERRAGESDERMLHGPVSCGVRIGRGGSKFRGLVTCGNRVRALWNTGKILGFNAIKIFSSLGAKGGTLRLDLSQKHSKRKVSCK